MNDPAEFNVDVEGVACFAWRGGSGGATLRNFGDELGPLIVAEMVIGSRPGPEPVRPARCLSRSGSAPHFADATDAAWGSGINGNIQRQRYRPTGRARRRRRAPARHCWGRHRVPQVYGDPARWSLTVSRASQTLETSEVVARTLNELDRFAGFVCGTAGSVGRAGSDRRRRLRDRHIPARAHHRGRPRNPLEADVQAPCGIRVEVHRRRSGTAPTRHPFARDLDEARQLGGVPLPDFDVEGLERRSPWISGGRISRSSVAAADASSFALLRREADWSGENVALSAVGVLIGTRARGSAARSASAGTLPTKDSTRQGGRDHGRAARRASSDPAFSRH